MPITIKATATILCSHSVGMYCPSTAPKTTPKSETRTSAGRGPEKDGQRRFGIRRHGNDRKLGFIAELSQKKHAKCREKSFPFHIKPLKFNDLLEFLSIPEFIKLRLAMANEHHYLLCDVPVMSEEFGVGNELVKNAAQAFANA